jgi:hypothetical protein
VLLEGVTLGGLTYQSPAPVTGYVAFFTILLFLVGLILLPLREAARPRVEALEAIAVSAAPESGTLTQTRHAPAALDPVDR